MQFSFAAQGWQALSVISKLANARRFDILA
jgi:hypothetical protein